MKSSIRRFSIEGHDVVSTMDVRAALSKRPLSGTTTCVCSINKTKKALQVQKLDGFSKYHNTSLRGKEYGELMTSGRERRTRGFQVIFSEHIEEWSFSYLLAERLPDKAKKIKNRGKWRKHRSEAANYSAYSIN